jgi:hypothetical protein
MKLTMMQTAGKSPSIQSIHHSTMTFALQLLAVQLISMSPEQPPFAAYIVGNVLRERFTAWKGNWKWNFFRSDLGSVVTFTIFVCFSEQNLGKLQCLPDCLSMKNVRPVMILN